LAFDQLFVFLPSPFNGFGLSSNLSLIRSEAKVPGRENENLPFFGQSDMVYNVTPYFQRAGLELRLAMSYQSEYLSEVGEETYLDRYADQRFTMDLTASYAFFNNRYKATFQARNLTNEAEQEYQSLKNRRTLYVQTGRTISFGIAANF
jgi:outer membrane receptor protein involved in Fe transport